MNYKDLHSEFQKTNGARLALQASADEKPSNQVRVLSMHNIANASIRVK